MPTAVKKGPPLALAFRAILGGVKLAYEYLGLTLVHSLLWFALHFPLLMGLWSIWAHLSASLPEKGRFAYFSREEGRPVLVLANQDGKGSFRLPLEGLSDPEDPSLSPDGKKVAFVDGGRLCLLEVESGRWRVLREAGRADHPSFGPDGRVIVFALDDELYLMDLESGAEKRLTETPVPEGDPSFSPDGKRVAFVRPDEEGNDEIWVMELADGRTRQITRTKPPAANLMPAFSPDGTRLAFLARRDGRTEIHLVMADGRGETPLTRNRLEEESPVFSGSGSKIFFLARGAEGEATAY
ncbi:MAG: hypothetical protein K6U03_10205, partial [Firmicutes bacterium]|nr:hypothetical protein [Bacillota bacterium]